MQALAGSNEAWDTLVRAHQQPVFRLAYLLLGDVDDAEDAAQETFIRAFRALKTFDTDRALRPWLFSIAANLARNRRRSIARYLAAIQRLGRNEPAHAASIESNHAAGWDAQTVWQAIRRLGHQDQEVIYLRIFLEMPVEDTSAALGLPPGTVKSRLHRALERLRQIIQEHYPWLKETMV